MVAAAAFRSGIAGSGPRRAKFLLLLAFTSVLAAVEGNPRFIRATNLDPDERIVTTKYGGLKGRTYNVSDTVDMDVFLGIPYAKPPVGELRFARPEPISAWSPAVRDATAHGAKCVQRIIPIDEVLQGVPFSEDCLFVDIYTARESDASSSLKPVMVYFHPGGFYGGSGAKYNYTSLALKGVVVVSVSFRLDVFGYLSTQDDVIPGNFGLMDAALALDFIKEIIGDFGGDAGDVTLFGASSGSAMVSIFTLSPLTRGKFHKAIMQSGSALAPWAVFTPGRVANVPADIALALATRLNCSLPGSGNTANRSRDVLTCLRAADVEVLRQESVNMQEQDYFGGMVFIPVTGDTFGFLPETPEQLLAKTDELVAIPTIVGYSTDDGSWLVSDRDDDGVSYPELQFIINANVGLQFPPGDVTEVSQRVTKTYLPSNAMLLDPVQLRKIAVNMATDFSMVAFIIKQARLFARAGAGGQGSSAKKQGTYVYQFNHRPSYSRSPFWRGVGHSDEKGFVLGLPPGPDAFSFPTTTAEDRFISEMMTTMWTNFAKFGDPTPQALNYPEGLRWPTFGYRPDNQDLLLIDVEPAVKTFDKNSSVLAWTGDSGLDKSANRNNGNGRTQAGSLGLALSGVLIFWRILAL